MTLARNRKKRTKYKLSRKLRWQAIRPFKYEIIEEGTQETYNEAEDKELQTFMLTTWKLLSCATKPLMIAPFKVRVKAFILSNCPGYKKRLLKKIK